MSTRTIIGKTGLIEQYMGDSGSEGISKEWDATKTGGISGTQTIIEDDNGL